ncbi:MAG: NAD(P)-dependent oxidoreductase [Rhodospirillales bacterium]
MGAALVLPDIVVTEFLDEAALAGLADYRVLYDRELHRKPEALLAAAACARALIVRNRTQVRGPLLDAARKLEVVGRLGVGLDNIDLAACAARGVAVCPATGTNEDSVAEYVIAAALMLLRGAYHASDAVAAGTWPREALMGAEAMGKTLGLVGFGGTARATARRAKALGMQVAAADPNLSVRDPAWYEARYADLPALLAQSDAISLHVPLNDATRHLIGAAALARMKPGAVVINAARGGVLDEDAAVAALKSGRLGGLALDVFETEPLTAAAGARFAGLSNLILTPHIAGVTRESNARISHVTVANVRRVLEAR